MRSHGRHAQFATAANDCPYADAYHCRTPDCAQHWPPGTVRPDPLPQPRTIRISQAVRDRRGYRPDVTYYSDGLLSVPAPPHSRSHPAYWAVLHCGHIKHMNTLPGDVLTVGAYVLCHLCPAPPVWANQTVAHKMVLACGVCDCQDCGGSHWLPRGTSRTVWLPGHRAPVMSDGSTGGTRYLISRIVDGSYVMGDQS